MSVIQLDGVFVVDTGHQTLVADVQQSHTWCFIDTTAFRFNDTVFDLVAHAQTMTATDTVGFQHHFNIITESHAIDGYRMSAFEANGHGFSRDLHVFIPEFHAHDRVNDLDAGVQEFQVFGFVSRTQNVGIGRIGFLY